MDTLKDRIEGLKPLGLVKVDTNEFLVVYDGNPFRRVQLYSILTILFPNRARMLHQQKWHTYPEMRFY